jgi:hypothetical protein
VPVNVGLASGAFAAKSVVRFVTCDSVIEPEMLTAVPDVLLKLEVPLVVA